MLVGNINETEKFHEQLVDKFDIRKNSKSAKISSLKFMLKKPYLALWIPTNERSKFKLVCVKFKNSHILLIETMNVKLCLINFVYFFW